MIFQKDKGKELCVKGKVFYSGKPLVCLPVMKSTKEEIVEETKRLVSLNADAVEWRVDAFSQVHSLNAIREVLAELEPLLENIIFIFTFRSKAQGGECELPTAEIYDLHQVGAESGTVDFVDLEFFSTANPAKEIKELQKMGVRIIASHHDFDMTPEENVMLAILKQMKDSRADIVKLAVMPNESADVLALLAATNRFHIENKNTPVITMSMGKLGEISRISGEIFGSCLTFASAGEASAPGQIEIGKMAEILEILSTK